MKRPSALIALGLSFLGTACVARQPYPQTWAAPVLAAASACPRLAGSYAGLGEQRAKQITGKGPVIALATLLGLPERSPQLPPYARVDVQQWGGAGAADSLAARAHVEGETSVAATRIFVRDGSPGAQGPRHSRYACKDGMLTFTQRTFVGEQFFGWETRQAALTRAGDGALVVRQRESAVAVALLIIPVVAYEESWARFGVIRDSAP